MGKGEEGEGGRGWGRRRRGRGKCISYQQTSPVNWGISHGHK
jgi:hypothetical protein